MAFVETVAPEEATGEAAAIYEEAAARLGYVPNYALAFSARPTVYRAWVELNAAIKAQADLRRYELATLAAARRLRSSYCALAHGQALADQFLGTDGAVSLPAGPPTPGLSRVEVAATG